MSLINEALKKAQRARSDSPADETSAPPGTMGGVRIAKRSQPRSANTMVLIGGGALVLVVLSVVATVFLMNRPDAAEPSASTATPAPKVVPETAAPLAEPNPPLVLPKPLPAPAVASTTPAPAVTSAPEPKSTASLPVAGATTTSAAPVIVPPPTPVPVAPAPKADERVAAFVEAIRVTGIRSSGTESRVLMNDQVFRVNQIVDRTLGVRLVKVGTDNLTFADANGFTYVKHF